MTLNCNPIMYMSLNEVVERFLDARFKADCSSKQQDVWLKTKPPHVLKMSISSHVELGGDKCGFTDTINENDSKATI